MKVVARKKITAQRLAIFLCGFFITQCYASDPFAELEASVRQQSEQREQEKSAFEAYKASQRESFEDYMRKFHEEFEEYRTIASRAAENYQKKLSQTWVEPQVSSNKRWVQYGEGYKLRKVVDFEKELISFSYPKKSASALSIENARGELANLLTLTRKEAFESDEVAQEIEMTGKQALETLETDEVEATPILIAYLLGKNSFDQKIVNELTDYMLKERKVSQTYEGRQQVESWVFPLELPAALADKYKVKGSSQVEQEIVDASSPEILRKAGDSIWKTKQIAPAMVESLPAKARGYVTPINHGSREFSLSAELILAIIETESAFNPMAKSPVPAYGLMQIVPRSAGQDATAKLFGKPKILSPSYLYNGENNIEIGSVYFNILYYRYFKDISNPLSRLYCSIAAYNTGPGNVAKAMLGDSMSLKSAAAKVNTMKADEVYDHLLNNLPYEETVHYLNRVTSRLHKYEQAFSL